MICVCFFMNNIMQTMMMGYHNNTQIAQIRTIHSGSTPLGDSLVSCNHSWVDDSTCWNLSPCNDRKRVDSFQCLSLFPPTSFPYDIALTPVEYCRCLVNIISNSFKLDDPWSDKYTQIPTMVNNVPCQNILLQLVRFVDRRLVGFTYPFLTNDVKL